MGDILLNSTVSYLSTWHIQGNVFIVKIIVSILNEPNYVVYFERLFYTYIKKYLKKLCAY